MPWAYLSRLWRASYIVMWIYNYEVWRGILLRSRKQLICFLKIVNPLPTTQVVQGTYFYFLCHATVMSVRNNDRFFLWRVLLSTRSYVCLCFYVIWHVVSQYINWFSPHRVWHYFICSHFDYRLSHQQSLISMVISPLWIDIGWQLEQGTIEVRDTNLYFDIGKAFALHRTTEFKPNGIGSIHY